MRLLARLLLILCISGSGYSAETHVVSPLKLKVRVPGEPLGPAILMQHDEPVAGIIAAMTSYLSSKSLPILQSELTRIATQGQEPHIAGTLSWVSIIDDGFNDPTAREIWHSVARDNGAGPAVIHESLSSDPGLRALILAPGHETKGFQRLPLALAADVRKHFTRWYALQQLHSIASFDGAGQSPAPPEAITEQPSPSHSDLVEANRRMLGGEEFAAVANGESIGGNAGENHLAVNGAVDKDGRIIEFGNIQDLSGDTRSGLDSGRLGGITFQCRWPDYSISEIVLKAHLSYDAVKAIMLAAHGHNQDIRSPRPRTAQVAPPIVDTRPSFRAIIKSWLSRLKP